MPHAHIGGTAMGGPSGADHDGGFTPMGVNVHTHTDVKESSKDDHSINIKNKDVYPPPAAPIPYGVAMAPGMGPFSKAGGKRSWPHGGTAMGGPSGNDEGQVFDMPITGNFYTSVDEQTKDDHSIKLKNENINTPPVHPPITHPPPVFAHSPGAGFREAKEGVPEHYHVPAEAFEKRWGTDEEGGTAMGGPSGGDKPSDGPEGFPYPVQAGGTALGGPSGEDDGIDFDNGIHADFHTKVDEYSHDDHSIDIKHTDIYPPPPPVHFGPPGFGTPFKRGWESQGGWEPESGGTAMGGPSGDDGGQEFNMPITVNTETAIKESYADDHSIDIKHKDVHPAAFPEFGGPGPMIPEGGVTPFKRAYSPSSEDRTAGGGTAEGGPSGEDDGINFGDPTDVGVDSNVSENHEDNHAIKIDDTNVHKPEMPWMSYHEAPAPAPAPQPAEPVVHEAPPVVEHEQSPPVAEHEEAPACAPEVHNVVHTVTKTATQTVQETATVTETPAEHTLNHIQTVHETHTVHDVKTVTETPSEHVIQATKTVEHMETVTVTGAAHVVEGIHTVYVTPSEHVVHVTDTVTAPAAHVVETTETACASPSHVVETLWSVPSHVVETQAVPASQVPMVTPASKILYSSNVQSAYVSVATPSSHMAQESYNFRPHAPASSGYSMIPVDVPVASPSSSMASMAMPSGADPMHSAMASASATPSHGVMFTGDAARLSGGIVSAAAAVMGVLAFIL